MNTRSQRFLRTARIHASWMLFFIICAVGSVIVLAIAYQNRSGVGVFAAFLSFLLTAYSAAMHEVKSRNAMDLYYISIRR